MDDLHDNIDYEILISIGALLVFVVLVGGGLTWAAVTIVKALL